jgi:hypothetical protein
MTRALLKSKFLGSVLLLAGIITAIDIVGSRYGRSIPAEQKVGIIGTNGPATDGYECELPVGKSGAKWWFLRFYGAEQATTGVAAVSIHNLDTNLTMAVDCSNFYQIASGEQRTVFTGPWHNLPRVRVFMEGKADVIHFKLSVVQSVSTGNGLPIRIVAEPWVNSF